MSAANPYLIMRDSANVRTANALQVAISARDSAGAAVWFLGDGQPSQTVLELKTILAHPIAFSTNNIERMRIDGSGKVGVVPTVPRH